MKAKKKFGQNFLIDEYYINRIIETINVFSNDLILEVGPGQGALTKRLKEKGANLIAFEIDQDLKSILAPIEDEKTKIIYQDFLSSDIKAITEKYSNTHIIGNLPYYITTPILEHIIKSQINPQEIIIMVQKEVADRFLAKPHTKDYGYFTLYLKYFFNIERIVDVPNTAFNPIPKVESTVLKLKTRPDKPKVNIEKYQELLKSSFKQKRKQLKNNLSSYDFSIIKEILIKYGISENARAEELSEEVFIEICQNYPERYKLQIDR